MKSGSSVLGKGAQFRIVSAGPKKGNKTRVWRVIAFDMSCPVLTSAGIFPRIDHMKTASKAYFITTQQISKTLIK